MGTHTYLWVGGEVEVDGASEGAASLEAQGLGQRRHKPTDTCCLV